MGSANEFDSTRVVSALNDLLQLDHDAVQAYTIAIDLVRDARYRETLVEFRADHKRHIEDLAGLVRARGALPTEVSHPTGPLKLAVQSVGGVISDDALLLAFKAVEGQVRDKYQRATQAEYPAEVAAVVQAAFADENRHYRWVEQTLTERGVGKGTIQHGLMSVVERVHKALVDPLEAVERTLMDAVGNALGTKGSRGGSAAPSPADVASPTTGTRSRNETTFDATPPVTPIELDLTDDGPAFGR